MQLWKPRTYIAMSGYVPCMTSAPDGYSAYVNHIFSAGMSSSQRAESGHSFFKKYVNRKNSLIGFITRFNRALTHQRHEELVCNHVDVNERPRITPMVMMEEQMENIYTKKIFLMFQKEIGQIAVLLSFEGYPCRHMICFFKQKQIILLPEKYILRRWTKNAKAAIVYDTNADFEAHDGSDKGLMARHGLLAHKAAMLVDDASLTDARSSYLLGEFENLHLRVKEIDFDGNNVNPHSSSKSREQPCYTRSN
ncbi:Protein FAR-RED IMPAIRED RESPONSE 1 [Abeliophyllum distichum]|uniref:Protein FAR1-RELATED SEQUENCE n=1 Tax=Abeliophyllum distichum TaxID=126358 RepID=A0ABD1RY60_9LAMI